MNPCEAYLAAKKTVIEARLQQLLPVMEPAFAPLYKAMNYSLLAGGKRIRPILFLAALEALGKESSVYMDVACALECVHSYSLIHDDLPAMDNDDLRRGKPTNHRVFGEGMAILAGDGLLTFAFELLARQRVADAEKIGACIRVLAHAAGPAGMVGGQAYDLLSEGHGDIGTEGLKLMHRGKTGVIFEAVMSMAGILAAAPAAVRQVLQVYAEQLGLTFQITDDILDACGTEAELGKPVGSDVKNNKATYVTLFSLDKAKQLAQESAQQAVAAVAPLGASARFLRDLPEYLLVRVK